MALLNPCFRCNTNLAPSESPIIIGDEFLCQKCGNPRTAEPNIQTTNTIDLSSRILQSKLGELKIMLKNWSCYHFSDGMQHLGLVSSIKNILSANDGVIEGWAYDKYRIWTLVFLFRNETTGIYSFDSVTQQTDLQITKYAIGNIRDYLTFKKLI